MPIWLMTLTGASVVAVMLVGGFFLCFSDLIMRSLAKTAPPGGAEAMQIINRDVFRTLFMVLFLGMVPVSLFVAAYAMLALGGLPSLMIILGAVVYLVGVFGITVRCNVPLNTALEGMDVRADSTDVYWQETYVPRWTFWNTVRTVGCVVSAVLFLIALVAV